MTKSGFREVHHLPCCLSVQESPYQLLSSYVLYETQGKLSRAHICVQNVKFSSPLFSYHVNCATLDPTSQVGKTHSQRILHLENG